MMVDIGVGTLTLKLIVILLFYEAVVDVCIKFNPPIVVVVNDVALLMILTARTPWDR